ncbi:MAG: hypothetical protein NTZ53_14475 [Cyanobacteria bacterium]|nr:hypothetical protein [Cyanobacteriota bacterium]
MAKLWRLQGVLGNDILKGNLGNDLSLEGGDKGSEIEVAAEDDRHAVAELTFARLVAPIVADPCS